MNKRNLLPVIILNIVIFFAPVIAVLYSGIMGGDPKENQLLAAVVLFGLGALSTMLLCFLYDMIKDSND